MKKRIHLICNAHLDPVWQWEWEEGAAETLSTFRIAADFCDKYNDFVFCHNESLLYRWVEEYEPELFQKIVTLVKEGKWHIMGGWHLQPDCNMPSGEGFVRQILEGRTYFEKNFGKRPTTAINFDPFGHTRGLVQIMAKSGFDSYIFCRPGPNDCKLPAEQFNWIGYDGSVVTGCRVASGYNSGLGKSINKIKPVIEKCKEDGVAICLWGVGNHGGGPSKIDLDAIKELQAEMKETNIDVLHSTPEEYFKELREHEVLPDHAADLNSWAPGCYTSQVRIKQKYRLTENTYFATECMCASAEIAGKMKYPKDELSAAMYDLLTIQFHDALPGSSIQPVEEMAIRTLDHALEILSRVKARAFFALADGQRKAQSDEIPILVYNPHPYEVDGTFECEFMLWDQNWNVEFSQPVVYYNGEKIPSQAEKEMSNLPLDWRKRVAFHAKLAPMQMTRFDCKFIKLPAKPIPEMAKTPTYYLFKNNNTQMKLNRKTGLVDSFIVDGTEFVKKGAFSLDIMKDNVDPWGMNDQSWTEKIGAFSLLSPEEGTAFSNVKKTLPSVRVIEDGDVRTVVEAVFGYESARAVVHYKLSKNSSALDIDVRIIWDQKSKMVKFSIPSAIKGANCLGQVAYGVENLPVNGKENISQKYLLLDNGAHALSVINNGIYGSSCEKETLKLTLLRSPAYTAHPINDREIMPQDRFMPYIEQGERLYSFRIHAGTSEQLIGSTAREADLFNEKPMPLSFFPSGSGKMPTAPLVLLENQVVEVTTVKKAENENGYIIRLFNPTEKKQDVTVHSDILSVHDKVVLTPYEILTLRIFDGTITKCDLTEKEI